MKSTYRFGQVRFALVSAMGITAAVLAACAGDLAMGPSEPCGFDGANCTTNGTGGGGGDFSDTGGQQSTAVAGAGGAVDAHDEWPDGDPPNPDPPDGGPNEDAGIPSACAGIPMEPYVVYVSADDSNSMGSPGIVREIINIGFEPNPARIRTYEFLNYYRINYPAAELGKLSIIPEMAKTAEPKIAEFQLALRSFDAPARRTMNFSFLVDTSGSMKGPGLERAKAAVHALASQFVPGDVVSFLSTDSAAPKLAGHIVTAPNDPELLATVNGLTTGGNTDLKTSLEKAFSLVNEYRMDNRMNRVIFISDGGVNVGVTDTDLLAAQSQDGDREGIYFVGIGTGPVLSFNDNLMNKLTDKGRGAYVYLDSVEEAKKILADRFDETMDIAARAVQVQLTLPWYMQAEGVSLEKNVSPTPLEPQHLAPNDAMVFFMNVHACDASLFDRDDPVTIRVSWNTRDKQEPRITESQASLNSLFVQNSPTMDKGRAIVAYAEALKGCGFDDEGFSLCKDDTERQKETKKKLTTALELAMNARMIQPPPGPDAELEEIISLIQIHPLMQP